MSLRAVLLLCVAVSSVLGACPASSAISPCTCREEMPGRTLDCASITSGSQLATLMQNDMEDPHFDFFQAIKMDGVVSLDSLPANTFAGKTLTHIWIGDTNMASVDAAAFQGLEPRLLEILMGATPSLTSFPYSSLAPLPLLFKLQITSSGLTSISSFGAAPELSEIRLTNAAISSIASGSFGELPNLAIVDLAGNAFTEITDGAFTSATTQPWTLYLDDNQIATVSAGAFSGTLPSGVQLKNNNLMTLDEATFAPLVDNMATNYAVNTTAAGMWVAGNPITCDCAIAWFGANPTRLPFVKNAVCANDPVTGTAVEDLPADFFSAC